MRFRTMEGQCIGFSRPNTKNPKFETYPPKIAKIPKNYIPKNICLQTKIPFNFLDIDPFLMIFAPFESSRSPLSNGIKIIKNGYILTKIWHNLSENFQAAQFVSDVRSASDDDEYIDKICILTNISHLICKVQTQSTTHDTQKTPKPQNTQKPTVPPRPKYFDFWKRVLNWSAFMSPTDTIQ